MRTRGAFTVFIVGLAAAACSPLGQGHDQITLPEGESDTDASSSGDPVDAHVDFETSSGSGSESGSSSGGTVPAGIVGAHDGVYVGSVAIDFVGAGACTGMVTITVDIANDPPIVGTGSCQGQIFGVGDGGETTIEGLLLEGGPSGTAQQSLNGMDLEVTWDGAFGDEFFEGSFDGSFVFQDEPWQFQGTWNTDR